MAPLVSLCMRLFPAIPLPPQQTFAPLKPLGPRALIWPMLYIDMCHMKGLQSAERVCFCFFTTLSVLNIALIFKMYFNFLLSQSITIYIK